MQNAYFQIATRGDNHWWRYIVGAFLTLSCFFASSTASILLLWAYVKVDGDPATRVPSSDAIAAGGPLVEGVAPILQYVVFNLSFPFFLLGLYLSLRYLHRRSLKTLITPASRISYGRIFQGFIVFFLLKSFEVLLSYFMAPSEFALNFQLGSFLAFLPFVVLLTPLQTTTEELFFRGYLMQGTGSRLGKWMAILLPSLFFMMLHLSNPEVTTQENWEGVVSLAMYYFLTAAFLSWLTIKDKSLELAIGVHAANNMATLLWVTSSNSVLPSPAVFSLDEIEASFSIVFTTVAGFLLFSFIVFRLLKRPEAMI